MKRKPVIPDFSKKPKGKAPLSKTPDATRAPAPPPPATLNRSMKPQGTAAKSGQRGR
jgi:hypothetical protein